eukprot:10357455-Alexandrium_andersonii.AAC.1
MSASLVGSEMCIRDSSSSWLLHSVSDSCWKVVRAKKSCSLVQMHVLAARGHGARLARCVATCVVQIECIAHHALG